jgi:hypothetical protein
MCFTILVNIGYIHLSTNITKLDGKIVTEVVNICFIYSVYFLYVNSPA